MVTRILAIFLLSFVGFGQTPRFKQIGSCDLEPDSWYDCFDVIVLDSFAFLADEDLTVINIARPDSPFVVTKIDTTHAFRNAMAPTPPYIYAMGIYGLGSFDISNLQSPLFLDSIDIPLWGDMALHNKYAYCSGGFLHVADVSIPDTLQYLGVVDSTTIAGRLTIGNNFLYELISVCSLFVYDLTFPSNPEKISSYSLPDAVGLSESEPFFKDSLLYIPRVSLWGPHIALWVVNVADPYDPFLLAESVDIGEYVEGALDLTVSGNFAYATINCNLTSRDITPRQQEHVPQLAVFDVSRPENPLPVWIWQQEHGDNYRGIDSRADTIYVCDGYSFYIYVDSLWIGIEEGTKIANTKIPTLLVYPSPFSIKTDIRFRNINNSNVQLKIYDITGRLVKNFSVPTTNSLVPTVVPWDGRDGKGNMLGNGVYFVVLEGRGLRPVSQKVVLLK